MLKTNSPTSRGAMLALPFLTARGNSAVRLIENLGAELEEPMSPDSARDNAASNIFVEIPCPVCQGKRFRTVIEFTPDEFLHERRKAYYNFGVLGINGSTPFKIVRCRECGFVFVNPRFRANLYEVVYNEAKSGKYDDEADWLATTGDLHHLFHSYLASTVVPFFLKAVYQFHDRFKKPRNENQRALKLLDYGSGCGGILEFCRAFGVEGTGVDLDRVRIEYTKGRGHRVFRPNDLPTDEKFDIVISTSVIEHVNDLESYLTFISGHLLPGGVFLCTGLNPRIIPIERRRGVFRLVMPFEHINYFTPSSLERIAARYGLTREKQRVTIQPGNGLAKYIFPILKDLVFRGFYPNGNFEAVFRKTL